jgi:hypothetical protein
VNEVVESYKYEVEQDHKYILIDIQGPPAISIYLIKDVRFSCFFVWLRP